MLAYDFDLRGYRRSLLLSMLGCMDGQGVIAQNGTISPIQTVC